MADDLHHYRHVSHADFTGASGKAELPELNPRAFYIYTAVGIAVAVALVAIGVAIWAHFTGLTGNQSLNNLTVRESLKVGTGSRVRFLAHGVVRLTQGTTAATRPTSTTVVFSDPAPVAPRVVVTPLQTKNSGEFTELTWSVQNVTTTGFEILADDPTNGGIDTDISATWIAIA